MTAPGEQLFPRAHLQGGTALRQRHGSHIEDWPEHAFAEFVRQAAHGLRQYERDRLAITLLYGGALRVSDLCRVRIEHLEDVEAGVLVHLPTAKYNPNGHHVDVTLLERRDDLLCPVEQLHRHLAVWPFQQGPLVAPVRAAEWPETGPPRPVNTREVARRLEEVLSSSGIEIPITTHSFRRTRASMEYAAHGDKLRVKRKLRHRSWRYVDRYIEQLDVWRHNPTIGIADGA